MAGHHRRVLVVEDDDVGRELLVSTLRHRFLDVDEAADGQQALELLRQNHYGVILVDLLLPKVDGFGVIEAIDPADYPPIVIVVTGADRHLLDRIDPRKIHGVVKKPFDPQDVADVVAACAEIRGRGSLDTMAYASILTGGSLIALLNM